MRERYKVRGKAAEPVTRGLALCFIQKHDGKPLRAMSGVYIFSFK